MKDSEILVSICSITYNHAPYIRQCLDGFLMQQTTFKFEIIIHDDCSTDGTKEIIEEYVAKYPNLFIPIFQAENQYSKGVRGMFATFVFPRAKGRYIAMCEGDDYWIDPLKLQKQVDFLERNPDYGLVYAKAKTFIQKKNKFGNVIGDKNCDFNSMLLNNVIPTVTVLYRCECYDGFVEFMEGKQWCMGDKPLWLYIAMTHKCHYEDKVTAVYRVLENSAMCRNSYEKRIDFINSSYDVSLFFAYKKNESLINDIIRIKIIMLLSTSFQYGKYKEVIQYYKELKDPDLRSTVKYVVSLLMKFI